MEASEYIDISLRYYQELEAGEKLPSINLFINICEKLRTPAYCLLQSDSTAFYYSNRGIYDAIRTCDKDVLINVITALDSINNNTTFKDYFNSK